MISLASVLLAAALSQLPAGHPPVPDALPEGHPPTRGAAPPTAEELIRRLDATPGLREREKTFEIAVALGKLYASNGRFADAAHYYGQAWEQGQRVATLYAKARGPASGSCPDPAMPLEKIDGQTPAACVQIAMGAVAEAAVARAHALFLAGDPKAAIAALGSLLAVAPNDSDALFARGSILLETAGDDLGALRQAKRDLERATAVAPQSERGKRAAALVPRADQFIAAGGAKRFAQKRAAERKQSPPALSSRAAAGGGSAGGATGGIAPALSPEVMAALSNVERTPELEKQVEAAVEQGEAHLAAQRFDQALESYKQVMPVMPDNARARAGLAWAMVGLGRPAADRMWRVAVQTDPAAVEMLGHALVAHGDAPGAKKLWTRLVQSAPEYAQSTGLAERIR